MADAILTTEINATLIITLNRPDARNAMTKCMAEMISTALDHLDSARHLQCAIITGAGGHFCSGMDLKSFLNGELPVAGNRGFGALTTYTPQKPVIAAVDGYALAGGFELALACDLIVASEGAKFGISEVKRGLVAGGGGLVQLPRLIPRALAMELALTGNPITASRAAELGLINSVTQGPALDAALTLAALIAENAPLALAASKAVIRESWLWPQDEINQLQNPYIAGVFDSDDAREGATAFSEKRQPIWRGC
jgi:enoyl-CoA hydratase